MSSNAIIGAGELGDWQRWTLGELGVQTQGKPASSGQARAAAQPDPLALLSQVTAEEVVRALDAQPDLAADEPAVAAVLAEAAPAVGYPTAAELEAIHQDAWQAGFEAGRAEGYQQGLAQGEQDGLAQGQEKRQQQAEAEAAAHFAELWTPLQQTLAAWDAGLFSLQAALAPKLAALALDIGQRLAGEQLQADPQALNRLVDEVLTPLAAELTRLTVRVHPDDAAALEHFLSRQYPQLTVRWIDDAALARGGCVIDAPVVRLDLSLETRTAQLREALGLDVDG